MEPNSSVSRKRDIWVSQGIPKLILYKRSFKQPFPANNPQKQSFCGNIHHKKNSIKPYDSATDQERSYISF